MEDVSTSSYSMFTPGDVKASYASGSFSKYSEIFFLRSYMNKTYDRKYLKVDEVISYIGGFSQIFLIFFSIIGKEAIF